MRTLRAEPLLELTAAVDGWSDPVAVGVGFDGAVYAASRRSEEVNHTKNAGGASFPKSQLNEPTDYLVVRMYDGHSQSFVKRGETIAAHYVQPFPGGVLLAGARCYWSKSRGPERNAVAVDWNGDELARFTLGDGIGNLRTARDGTIWASFFDEGVFGNYGWNHPGPSPIGEPGLVAFSPTGEIAFTYDAEKAGTDAVCDAYAMNVTDDATWLYFYTEFPIVRIARGEYRTWSLGVGGAHAIAVRDGGALLFGDYKTRNQARLVALGASDAATVTEEVSVEDDRGTPLDHARAWGIGSELYLVQDRHVFVLREW